MSLHLITPPTDFPLTVTDVLRRLKIDAGDDNEYIEFLIKQLTGLIDAGEGILGHTLCRQTWEYRIQAFPGGKIEIPLPPLVSVSSVKHLDPAEVEQTLVAVTDYVVIDQGSFPSIIQPALGKSWPATACNRADAVRIQFLAGYLTASIPPPIIAWMLREIGKAFESRDENLSPDYSEILRYRTIALQPTYETVL